MNRIARKECAATSETGTTMTCEWMLTVLQELGYGRLPVGYDAIRFARA